MLISAARLLMQLLAVHLSDGVMPVWPWIGGGILLAIVLVAIGCRRIQDDEVPQIALLTAAFFVGSLVHVRVGPVSVHLILNGLIGVMLGVRAGLAIAIGLSLQVLLFGHGGFSALGVNTCVMTIPALAAGWSYRLLAGKPAARFVASFFAAAVWALAVVFSIGWLMRGWETLLANWPFVVAGISAFGTVIVILERRADVRPEFPLGLLLGTVTVLATVTLNAIVLACVLPPDAEPIAAAILLAHMPIAAIEGCVVGIALGFLGRVAPHRLPRPTSSGGIFRKDLGERDFPLPEPDADNR